MFGKDPQLFAYEPLHGFRDERDAVASGVAGSPTCSPGPRDDRRLLRVDVRVVYAASESAG